MDLTYGEKYEAFRAEVRAFLDEHKASAPRQLEANMKELRPWQQMLLERGYVARSIPKEYGGYGAPPDLIESSILSEEFSRAQVPQGIGGQGIWFLVPAMLDIGTEEQRREFLPPTIRGDMLWCQGYSEPNAGSDLASLKTSAYLDGDEWVVNGQKIWTSTAQHADWMFCLVRTEPDAKKHAGISFLLFPMNTPGIEVRPLRTMANDETFNEVFLTDVRVPKHQMLGGRGEGWGVANKVLQYERDSLGNATSTLTRINQLIELMKRETVDGRRLIDDPVFLDRLMRIQGAALALRHNDLRLLSGKLNKNLDSFMPIMVVKLLGTELRHELEGLAIDAMGELGTLYGEGPYLRDAGMWQFMYMFSLGLIIGGGTSQIQKNIISERGLGMPREPKVKKD